MIVIDIETSGLDFDKCGIWQIGAVDFSNSESQFYEEGKIDDNDIIEDGAKKVCGKKESEFRDSAKQTQKQLLINFFNWCSKIKIKNCIFQNPQFDFGFLEFKSRKYGLNFPFHHRAFDLHSFASLKYFQIYGKFLIDRNHSDMSLRNILEFCGMNDPRGKHNALEDVKLTAECFSRIVYGKYLFQEYNKFKMPIYLKEGK